jgi:putative membrane protein
MVTYNPKDWFTLIFQFHKSDTFRKLLPVMFATGLFSALVVFIEVYVFHWSFNNSSVIHSILGFVLSMLLVFRTNSAYDRWWEGRKLWGDIVNNSRNLAFKIKSFVKDEDSRNEFIKLIYSYNYILKDHLRNKTEISDQIEISDEIKKELATAKHKPNVVASRFYAKLNTFAVNKQLSETHLLLLNDEVKSFTNVCGACERIRNTPIPYSYNLFLKKIIFLYVITIPFMFGPDFKYATIIIAMIVLYVFASIELIAEEIEDPFGEDDNDLPLDDICINVKSNLTELIK